MSNNNKGATTQSNNRGKYRHSDMGIGRAGASTQRHKGKPSVIRGVSLQSSSQSNEAHHQWIGQSMHCINWQPQSDQRGFDSSHHPNSKEARDTRIEHSKHK